MLERWTMEGMVISCLGQNILVMFHMYLFFFYSEHPWQEKQCLGLCKGWYFGKYLTYWAEVLLTYKAQKRQVSSVIHSVHVLWQAHFQISVFVLNCPKLFRSQLMYVANYSKRKCSIGFVVSSYYKDCDLWLFSNETRVCQWAAVDFSTDEPIKRTFMAQFSSTPALKEFIEHFHKVCSLCAIFLWNSLCKLYVH